jgi:hypothetical protein
LRGRDTLGIGRCAQAPLEVARRKAERLKEEVRKDLEALDAYEAEHGSFVEMMRQHYDPASDDAS